MEKLTIKDVKAICEADRDREVREKWQGGTMEKTKPGSGKWKTEKEMADLCHRTDAEKTKHTPEPWKIFYPRMRAGAKIITDDPLYPIVEIEELRPEWKANARLIAAAPDLLAVCKETTSLLSGAFWEKSSIRQELLAAISKAEGKE